MNEAEIIINGVKLSSVQSSAVRRACTAFLMMLADRKFSEALGIKAVTDREVIAEVMNIMHME